MNKRIKQLADTAGLADEVRDGSRNAELEKFAELLLANLADELFDVANRSRSRGAHPAWADGMNHAAMLAQRMTMDLPQWPEAV